MERTPIFYISSEETKGEVVLPPDRLDKIINDLSFYCMKPHRTVAFVDCFEKLVEVNGFEKAFGFLNELVGVCSQKGSNLLVQIVAEKFEKGQLAQLEKIGNYFDTE